MSNTNNDNTATVPSRRTVAKGVAWAIPAVSVTSAAPALAASCVPTTKNISSIVDITQSRDATALPDPETNPEGDNLVNNIVTFTNSGPDTLPAGLTFDVSFSDVLVEGVDHDLSVDSVPGAQVTLTQDPTGVPQTDADGNTTVTYSPSAKITLTQSLAKDGAITITFHTLTGALGEPGVTVPFTNPDPQYGDETNIPSAWASVSATNDGVQTVTDGCTTTITNITVNDPTRVG